MTSHATDRALCVKSSSSTCNVTVIDLVSGWLTEHCYDCVVVFLTCSGWMAAWEFISTSNSRHHDDRLLPMLNRLALYDHKSSVLTVMPPSHLCTSIHLCYYCSQKRWQYCFQHRQNCDMITYEELLDEILCEHVLWQKPIEFQGQRSRSDGLFTCFLCAWYRLNQLAWIREMSFARWHPFDFPWKRQQYCMLPRHGPQAVLSFEQGLPVMVKYLNCHSDLYLYSWIKYFSLKFKYSVGYLSLISALNNLSTRVLGTALMMLMI